MQKTLFLNIALLLVAGLSKAQQIDAAVPPEHLHFRSFNALGLVEGQKKTSWQLQSVNGIQMKKWFVGAGAGLDYYFIRSIPVFLDLRASLFQKSSTPFLYLDGGYHYLWAKDKEKEAFEVKSSGGLYYDLGIGYQFAAFNNQRLVLSAGLTQKDFSRTINVMPWVSVWPAPPNAVQKFEYSLKRLSLKAGLSF